jgi:hypothetical protein
VAIREDPMTPDEYMANCKPIHAELAAIATRTRQMAHAHSAHDENPEYVSIMDKQDALLHKLAEFDRLVMLP